MGFDEAPMDEDLCKVPIDKELSKGVSLGLHEVAIEKELCKAPRSPHKEGDLYTDTYANFSLSSSRYGVLQKVLIEKGLLKSPRGFLEPILMSNSAKPLQKRGLQSLYRKWALYTHAYIHFGIFSDRYRVLHEAPIELRLQST